MHLSSSLAASRALSTRQTGLLFLLAVSPQFVAAWASTRIPSENGRPALPTASIGIVSVGTLILLAMLSFIDAKRADFGIDPRVIATALLATLLPPLTVNWLQAPRERKLPVSKRDRQPEHISGV